MIFYLILLLNNQLVFHCCLSYSFLKYPLLVDNEYLIEFNNKNHSSNFSNFYHYKDSLYVTGTNYVFKLNFLNISDRSPSIYKEAFINPSNFFHINSTKLKNHIKLLIFRERSQDLIICGTNLGKPHIKDLNMNDFSSIVEFDGFYLCPGVEDHANLGYISYESPGNSKSLTKGLMYSAIWKTDSNIYGDFLKYGIYRQEIDSRNKILKSFPDKIWLWEPNFISIIDYGDKIFYFFTEYSIEEYFLNKKLKRTSRAARVCKSDVGLESQKNPSFNNYWLTFRKINFNCENKYSNLVLIKQVKSKLIAIFYEKEQGSIICEVSLEEVKEKLESKKFWINRDQKIDKENFHLYDEDFDCENIPKVETELRFHGNKITDDEFLNELSFGFKSYTNTHNDDDLEVLNEFLIKHTILDNRLTALELLKLPKKIICMSYDNLNSDIFHLGTSKNELVLLKKNNEGFLDPVLLNLNKSIQNESLIEMLVKNGNIYLGTTNSIYQIKIVDLLKKFCNSIRQCFKCENYFFCTWFSNKCKYEKNIKNNISCSNEIRNVSFELGGNLKLDCLENFNGDVKWKKDQVWIEQTNLDYFNNNIGQLYLANLTISNDGVYTCVSEKNQNLISYQINGKMNESDIDKFDDTNKTSEKYFQNFTSFLNNFEDLINFFNNECLNKS